RAKERILSFFFRHMPLDRVEETCRAFSREDLPRLLRPKALREIARLNEAGAQVVVVSASPENWIRDWAASVGVQLVATRLETVRCKDNGELHKLTGRILCANCHGEEKVRRIKESYDLSGYQHIYTYGDSRADRPMLRLGTASFYKPFR
ncbi:MAG TPA: HAD-IB family phosphatase, partial [Puia sp.]|nr:HAD-IB family phosphatase [Puia sp.]